MDPPHRTRFGPSALQNSIPVPVQGTMLLLSEALKLLNPTVDLINLEVPQTVPQGDH